jgi:AhpD family alkylhydroperoxidase
MARLSYIEIDGFPEALRERIARVPRMNIFHMLAHSPSVAQVYEMAMAGVYQSELDPRLRELAILRVAHLTGARYPWAHHVTAAKSVGVTDAEVAAIPQGPEGEAFGDLERKVLRFADEMAKDVKVSDATFHALAELLSPRCLMQLAITVSFYGMIARIAETFEVDVEPTAGSLTIEQFRP